MRRPERASNVEVTNGTFSMLGARSYRLIESGHSFARPWAGLNFA